MSRESTWSDSTDTHTTYNAFASGGGALWREFVDYAKDYARDAVEHLLLAAFVYLAICFMVYVLATRWNLLQFESDIRDAKRTLIVIAHPDDEAMFFGPVVRSFARRRNCSLYLMCMSAGRNYGMDKIRKRELYESCKLLGIDQERVTVYNHTLMPDSISERWPADLLGKLILRQIETYDIDTLITFDKHGVSRHPNHCSIYYAVAHLSVERCLPKNCRVFVLESVNVLRKYWLILDLPLCLLLSRYRFITKGDDRKTIRSAMKRHKSQLTWYRRLYLVFSRYTVINTLQRMDISDIELDLEIDD